ncbi:MAG: segregation/condensation protein A [Clostridia bacterium]
METTEKHGVRIRLDNFEGPLDLLFHLIEVNEMDIYDIRISDITHQYMDYLFAMQNLNLDIASEFLVMASTLLHIKSRMLLPQEMTREDQEQGDPRDMLVHKLLEYRRYKQASETLKALYDRGGKYFYRGMSMEGIGETERTYSLSPGTLKSMYAGILDRNMKKKNIKGRHMRKILMHEKFTVRKKIAEIARMLFRENRISFFDRIRKQDAEPIDVVVGFLSILELAKENKAVLKQKGQFSDISIEKTEHLKENDFQSYTDLYR